MPPFKKRTTTTTTPQEIEAFGDAAEQSPTDSQAKPAPAAQRKPHAENPVAGEWPADLARQMLIRWPNPTLVQQLVETTALLKDAGNIDGRSQHATALRALERGLQAIRSELHS